jgi:hypothetical protein
MISAIASTIPPRMRRKISPTKKTAHFREWKTSDVERFRRAVRKIIRFDLDLIENKADYLICHLAAQ